MAMAALRRNIHEFQNVTAMLLNLDSARLDDGDGIEVTLKKNSVTRNLTRMTLSGPHGKTSSL